MDELFKCYVEEKNEVLRKVGLRDEAYPENYLED
jgi:hypothetical protein